MKKGKSAKKEESTTPSAEAAATPPVQEGSLKDPVAAMGYVPGTVEYAARVHWEREKAGYEQRTGEKVTYEPPFDPGQTPIEKVEEVEEVQEAEEGEKIDRE